MTPEQAIKNIELHRLSAVWNETGANHDLLLESVRLLQEKIPYWQKIEQHCQEQELIELIFEKDIANGRKGPANGQADSE